MAANMFVSIKDIPGDATEEKHIGWIPVKTVGWSVERVVDLSDLGSTQRGYANANFAKLAVTSELGKASPKLMLAAANGTVRDEIKVAQCRVTDDKDSAMEEYLVWTLKNAQITKYDLSCSEDGVPEETWEMGYRQIDVELQIVDAATFKKGAKEVFKWNLETNKYA